MPQNIYKSESFASLGNTSPLADVIMENKGGLHRADVLICQWNRGRQMRMIIGMAIVLLILSASSCNATEIGFQGAVNENTSRIVCNEGVESGEYTISFIPRLHEILLRRGVTMWQSKQSIGLSLSRWPYC